MADEDPPHPAEEWIFSDAGLEDDDFEDEPPEQATVVAMACPLCGKVAMHDVMGRAYWDGYGQGRVIEGPPTEWRLLQCQRCDGVSVDERNDFGLGMTEEASLTYPARRQLSAEIPEALRDEWREGQEALAARLFKSAVGAVRRLVEGTCEDAGVTKGDLYDRLKTMLEEGKINQTLYDWADLLRLVGNEGSHYNKSGVEQEDAEDALHFAEALLDHIYVLSKRFTSFEARQKARKAAKNAPGAVSPEGSAGGPSPTGQEP